MLSLRVDDAASEVDGRAVWAVYEAVFGDFPCHEAWRDGMWNKHRAAGGLLPGPGL